VRALRLYALLFVVGGVGIAVLDHLHVEAGTTSYADPTAFGQPWWVIPQMGLATILATVAGRAFVRREVARPGELRIRIALFATAYATTALLWKHSLVLLGLLLAAWMVTIVVTAEGRPTILYCLLFAAIGTGYEMALVAAGVFEYAEPEALGVQVWLPGLYLIAGLLGVTLARTFPAQPVEAPPGRSLRGVTGPEGASDG
jgi:hypothetical protein